MIEEHSAMYGGLRGQHLTVQSHHAGRGEGIQSPCAMVVCLHTILLFAEEEGEG